MANNPVQTENKMGVMPINKLLISMSLPMVISMLVQALYNIVDSIFVSMICEDALTAVSLAFPMQNFMIAVATGTGVGVNAMLSKALGEKDFDKANSAAKNGIFITLCSYIVFLILGLFFTNIYFSSQAEGLQTIIDYGNAYMQPVLILSFGLFGQIIFERLLQSTGKTMYTMITQATGAIINIILDPILIFGWLGFPEMGITGAAVATVIGQIVAAVLGVIFNVKKNHEISLNLKKFRPSGQIIKRIYAVGVPSIIMVSISSVLIFGMNIILIGMSATAATVLGIYFKLQSFVFMPVFGLNNGMIPIISYNFGARSRKRIMETFRLSVIYAVSIMVVGLIVCQAIPEILLAMFNPSTELLSIGVPALRIISLSFIFAAFGIVSSSMFQALGNGMMSLIVSVIRQLVVILPVAYLLSLTGSVELVWWSYPIAEVVSVIVSILFMIRVYNKEIKPIA